MRENISVQTLQREELVDITKQVQDAVTHSRVENGLMFLYVQGATAALMIQENWDESVQTDVVNLLQKLIPRGVLVTRPAGRQWGFSPESRPGGAF